jgi:hypothetical protein
MRSAILFFTFFILFVLPGKTQTVIANFNAKLDTTIWAGWKLGNVIKVTGIVKYGDSSLKENGKRYILVQKIDGAALNPDKKIEIFYDEELFKKLKNNESVTLLGYVSGGYYGVPNFNNYYDESLLWQGVGFGFSLDFVVIKKEP